MRAVFGWLKERRAARVVLMAGPISPATSPAPKSIETAVRSRLDRMSLVDAARLERRLVQLRARRNAASEWTKLEAQSSAAIASQERRLSQKPAIEYPPELPITARVAEIADAIREHPVVIVCGETGSGKTTQLPKICLAAGRGERGMIGHTQPRRIAARAVASRIAQELGTPVGAAVGYKVRFTDRTHPDAFIKVMTDGVLLAETHGDRDLLAYDTIIVDEAHERSLNIDFLLGYLARLVRRRADLRVIITSATLDADRFARHFAGSVGPAPVIEVSGRTFPVEIRYRPLAADDVETDDEEELEEAIASAADALWREGPGDILAFLPGEREIRETGDVVRKHFARSRFANLVEVLPLYARLSVEEQQRVFAPSNGRRIVLATNVAETSLTVPGVRYVIDTGLARIKRYALRSKTTLLAIEKISQAAANQRAGRCGRVADGICIRLYAEDDFTARPRFTEPEIQRSSLASVILRMAALGLGAVDRFPFVDAPSPRAIADGYQLLQELGAVDASNALTSSGRELARLPLDPRIGRILQAARDEGCVAEALVIASALSVPDPRDRPLERRQAADQAHLRFRDERSDFLSLIALWEFFAEAQKEKLSHRRLVEHCRAQFVSWLRLVEWRDVQRELAQALAEAGWRFDPALPAKIDDARYASIHRALLAGLLGSIGVRSENDDGYDGARGVRFYLHPASGIQRKSPRFIVAAELTETTRLFARIAARVEPEWIEKVAADRVTREYFDPHWDEKRGEVVASERVQLYGLTLVARRPVSFGTIDAPAARDIFIREALVPGTLATRGTFAEHNRKLIAEVAALEHKARRQDVLVDDDTIAAFYAERIDPSVHSRATFERWRESVEAREPKRLFMTRDALMRHAAASVTEELFPETLAMAGATLPLKYRFEPSHPRDGITLTVPLPLLNQIDEARLSWLVPGMVRDKVTHYLKALPKAQRNRLIPLPDAVTAFLVDATDREVSLPDALREHLAQRFSEPLPRDLFDRVELLPHLAFNVRVVDAAGSELAEGRDLMALKERLGEAAQMSFAAAGPALERKGLRAWDFGDLPETLTSLRQGQRLTGYPALVDEDDSVSLALMDTAHAASAATRKGVLRLMRIQLKDLVGRHAKGGARFKETLRDLKGAFGEDALLADALDAIVDRAFLGDDPLPRDAQRFAAQVKRARSRMDAVADGAFELLHRIAASYAALSRRLSDLPPGLARLAADVKRQRDRLVFPGFFSATPWAQLQHLPRYLEALARRIDKYATHRDRDTRHAAQVDAWWLRYAERADSERKAGRHTPELEAFRWLLEELKVSLFAQELKTPMPVSYKRVEKAWAALSRT